MAFVCHLSAISVLDIFKSFQVFSRDWILSIGYHVNLADSGVSLRLSTFYIIFPTFLWIGISPYFTWVSTIFFRCIFLLDLRKKSREKSQQKIFPQTLYSLSREISILATPIPPSEKSNDSYKLMSLGAFFWIWSLIFDLIF